MADDLIATTSTVLETGNGVRNVPSLVVNAGGGAQKRFIEFFAAQIRNKNTREAYIRLLVRQAQLVLDDHRTDDQSGVFRRSALARWQTLIAALGQFVPRDAFA